jgi:hypothetical protein
MPTNTSKRGTRASKASSNTTRTSRSYFPGKDPTPTTISLTPLAKRIVKAAERRNKCSRSDVFEGLARKHGDDLMPADLMALSQQGTAVER